MLLIIIVKQIIKNGNAVFNVLLAGGKGMLFNGFLVFLSSSRMRGSIVFEIIYSRLHGNDRKLNF
jgi:hypothetical protein